MSPTSYQAAPPRVSSCRITGTPRESSRTEARNAPLHEAYHQGHDAGSALPTSPRPRISINAPSSRTHAAPRAACVERRAVRRPRGQGDAGRAAARHRHDDVSERRKSGARRRRTRISRPRSTPRARVTCCSSRPARRTSATSASARRPRQRARAPEDGSSSAPTSPTHALGAPGIAHDAVARRVAPARPHRVARTTTPPSARTRARTTGGSPAWRSGATPQTKLMNMLVRFGELGARTAHTRDDAA